MALARTWGFENGQALQDLITHLPKKHYRRCWIPVDEPGRRRTYRTYTKRACLRHIGDVTIVLSKQRRNDGPKQTKILVTNLPAVTARQVVDVYRRRWAVEVCQTQPVNMTWWPLRSVGGTGTFLRGEDTRERIGNINGLARYDNCANQALDPCLAVCKREPAQIVAEQLPTGVGLLNDGLPLQRGLWSRGELLPFRLDLWHLGEQLAPPALPLLKADDLGLISIEQTLALPLQALVVLPQLGLLGSRRQDCVVGPVPRSEGGGESRLGAGILDRARARPRRRAGRPAHAERGISRHAPTSEGRAPCSHPREIQISCRRSVGGCRSSPGRIRHL
jgi:hypothetical protein